MAGFDLVDGRANALENTLLGNAVENLLQGDASDDVIDGGNGVTARRGGSMPN